jgi:hypothetical protein
VGDLRAVSRERTRSSWYLREFSTVSVQCQYSVSTVSVRCEYSVSTVSVQCQHSVSAVYWVQ